MPTPPQSESWVPSDRYYVQLALGQVHGVLHRVVLDADFWLPPPGEAGSGSLTVDDLLDAYLEACRQLGTVQAALNTGAHDRPLASRGFSGAQLKAKLKGFWQAVKRYATASKNSVSAYVGRMQSALGWCGTIVGSVSTAFEEELKNIPGAAAAAEAVKEFIELLQHAAESFADNSPTASAKSEPGDQGRGKRKIDLNDD
jgi:hypothetical protein